ncbi:hypothetical protein [uncultured Roseobacter sp.]|uniref:hypothetical protein n=1 Tax=uncultured Roseobacter sp. TaxID=114847 RepID=UPI002634EB60|nr:hypothetical protein [uncultured Roseobacter sp.]
MADLAPDWTRGPGDIAILTAVPMTLEDFRADIAARAETDVRDVRGDYSQTALAGRRDGDIHASWVDTRAHVAELVQGLFEGLDRSDFAFTTTEARSEDIYKATLTGAKVILILAHWRGSNVTSNDLRPGVLGAIDGSLSEVSHFLATHRYSRQLGDHAYLADALSDWVHDRPGLEIARRTALEHAAPEHIVPGNCLELRDGFHKAPDLALQFVEEWSGVCELVICHSEYLALALKEDRQDRLMITNKTAKDPFRVLPEIREILLRSTLGPFAYCNERSKVFETFEKGLRQHAFH